MTGGTYHSGRSARRATTPAGDPYSVEFRVSFRHTGDQP